MTDHEALLTRLDKLRTFLIQQKDALRDMGDAALKQHAEEIIDRHLGTVDDASARLQVN